MGCGLLIVHPPPTEYTIETAPWQLPTPVVNTTWLNSQTQGPRNCVKYDYSQVQFKGWSKVYNVGDPPVQAYNPQTVDPAALFAENPTNQNWYVAAFYNLYWFDVNAVGRKKDGSTVNFALPGTGFSYKLTFDGKSATDHDGWLLAAMGDKLTISDVVAPSGYKFANPSAATTYTMGNWDTAITLYFDES